MLWMMWFDNSKDLLGNKARRAFKYYEAKYGKMPNTVLVHPCMMGKNAREFKVGKVRASLSNSILPNHLWIGVEE